MVTYFQPDQILTRIGQFLAKVIFLRTKNAKVSIKNRFSSQVATFDATMNSNLAPPESGLLVVTRKVINGMLFSQSVFLLDFRANL